MFQSSAWWNIGSSEAASAGAAGNNAAGANMTGGNPAGAAGVPDQYWEEEASTPATSEASEETGSEDLSDDDDEEDDESDMEDLPWKEWFLTLPGNEYLACVDDDFIEDEFNLTGLSASVPYYADAIDVILDNSIDDDADINLLDSSAQLLYTLIHARYITTKAGLQQMLGKLEGRQFGECPRALCYRYPLLPVGENDTPGMGVVKLFCHNCQDLYHSSSRYNRLDGAAFGTTFPHLMYQTYPELHSSLLELLQLPEPRPVLYVPKIFGFRINGNSMIRGNHAAWLRWQPGCHMRTGMSGGPGRASPLATGATTPSTPAGDQDGDDLEQGAADGAMPAAESSKPSTPINADGMDVDPASARN